MAEFESFTDAKLQEDLFAIVDGILQQHIQQMGEPDELVKERRDSYILELTSVMEIIQNELAKRSAIKIISKILIAKIVRPYHQQKNHCI